jgi:2-methylcitrate dehydratase PrpD
VRALAAKVSYDIDPQNPYPKQFTGHLAVTLKNGDVLEAEQGFFRGGRDAPMSRTDLEKKFLANCEYGQWTSSQAQGALELLSSLQKQSAVNVSSLRG